jgi:hypothetical protein
MFKNLQVMAVVMCMLSYTAAATVSIGTASARGDMRVDSYLVKGNATLFDGSVVETGQATADLRLSKGTEITMAASSRGTLYSDHLVLQRGKSELAANSTFRLEANGMRVIPNEPNSRGVVAVREGNTVEVAALSGSFGVANEQGVLLASVRPGRVISFAIQTQTQTGVATAPTPLSFSGVGLVTFENGHYYLTDNTDKKYELVGKDLRKYVGTKAIVAGTLQTQGDLSMITVKSIGINGGGPTGINTVPSLLITGAIVGAAVGIGLAISRATGASTAASI